MIPLLEFSLRLCMKSAIEPSVCAQQSGKVHSGEPSGHVEVLTLLCEYE